MDDTIEKIEEEKKFENPDIQGVYETFNELALNEEGVYDSGKFVSWINYFKDTYEGAEAILQLTKADEDVSSEKLLAIDNILKFDILPKVGEIVIQKRDAEDEEKKYLREKIKEILSIMEGKMVSEPSSTD